MCNHHIYLLTNEYMRNMICAISFGDQSSIINKLRKIYQKKNLDIISRNSPIRPTVQHFGTYVSTIDYLKLSWITEEKVFYKLIFIRIISSHFKNCRFEMILIWFIVWFRYVCYVNTNGDIIWPNKENQRD